MPRTRLGAGLLESSPVEKDRAVLADNRLSVSQQRAPVAKNASGILALHWDECCQHGMGGDPAPPLSPAEATCGGPCPVLGSPVQERPGAPAESPAEGYKDD